MHRRGDSVHKIKSPKKNKQVGSFENNPKKRSDAFCWIEQNEKVSCSVNDVITAIQYETIYNVAFSYKITDMIISQPIFFLAISTLCTDTTDNKMMMFFLFFPENRLCWLAWKFEDYYLGIIIKYYKMTCVEISTQHNKRYYCIKSSVARY